jgi:outer membrane protein, multidrug efflux system
MKFHSIRFLLVILTMFLYSCKTLNTDLKIKERKLPGSFTAEGTSGSSIGDINWKQFFADSSLIALIDTALNSNFDVMQALQRIEISQAAAGFAKGELLPKISPVLSGGMRRFGLYTMDGAGNISTDILPGKIVPINLPDYYIGVQSIWEIDIWGKLRNQKKAAIANYLSSIEGAHFVKVNLIAGIASNYYELLALDNQLDIIQETVRYQQEALDVVLAQKEAGRVNELAVLQFKAQVLNSKTLQSEVLMQINEVENNLNLLLGRYPQKIQRKPSVLLADFEAKMSEGVPSQLLQNRPDIRESEYQLQSSKFSLKAAKAAFYPNVNIVSGIGYQAFNPEYLFVTPASIAYNAIGNLVAPLINRNAIQANFKSAKAGQINAMYDYQKSLVNAFVEVSNELNRLNYLNEIHGFKKQQTDELQKSVETSKELYKSAKAGYMEVLIVQQNNLQAKLELVEISKRQRIANVNLYRALGGGWK